MEGKMFLIHCIKYDMFVTKVMSSHGVLTGVEDCMKMQRVTRKPCGLIIGNLFHDTAGQNTGLMIITISGMIQLELQMLGTPNGCQLGK